MWQNGGNWVSGLVGIVFYALVPGLILFYLLRAGFVQDLYPPERSQRGFLLLLGAVCYFLGFITLVFVEAPGFMLGAGCTYFGNALLVWQINKYWKISIHAVGVSGGLLILLLVVGRELWPCLFALPLVGWARLRLKLHTPAQVGGGALLGGCSAGLIMSLFSGLL